MTDVAPARPASPGKIALFADGTWNRGGPGAPTNVWRLHQAVDRTAPGVVTAHDDGVGTGGSRASKILGGAFGLGLYRNVTDLYAFLVRHYNVGDEIYLFGFSRGAFTVRLLSGVIERFGIVDRTRYEEGPEEAAAIVVRALRVIQAQDYRKSKVERFSDWTTRLSGRKHSHKKFIRSFRDTYCHQDVSIRLLGVWDTVRAFGGPFDGLVRTLNWLLCTGFSDQKLSSCVERGRHALAIDEGRKTFAEIQWDAPEADEDGRLQDIEQIWFAGAHADVGGGYEKQGLAACTLKWMMDEAVEAGLPIREEIRAEVAAEANPHGELHDPRAMTGLFYRFKPREVPVGAEVAPSVIQRIERGTGLYSPANLAPPMLGETAPEVPGFERPIHDRLRGSTWIRGFVHALNVFFLIVLLSCLAFATFDIPSQNGVPKLGVGALDAVQRAVEHVSPFKTLGQFLTRPIKALSDNGLLFWVTLCTVGGALFLAGLMKSRTQRESRRSWDRYRAKLNGLEESGGAV